MKTIFTSKRTYVVLLGAIIAVLEYLGTINMGGAEVATLLSILTGLTKVIDVQNEDSV